MSESFSVGEIAQIKPDVIAVSPGMDVYLGERVAIEGALRFVPGHRRPMHVVRCLADGEPFYACADVLRKIPPPQDWVKLCHLTDVPREVTHV